jgi:CRISPR/Cas system-associated exonuclease Cas4 (RecB family)
MLSNTSQDGTVDRKEFSNARMTMSDEFISASEIGEYLFCQRAWWYRLRGFVSTQRAAMETGTAVHEQIAQDVQTIAHGSRLARNVIVAGIILLVLVILLRFLLG